MHRRVRLALAATSALAAAVAAAPAAVATSGSTSAESAEAIQARPAFRMPFHCNQVWRGNNWSGHSPAHSIDWNHYNAAGTPDDEGRDVLASAAGTVTTSQYSTTTGYGNTIVISHGDGWSTRYAHLKVRSVGVGASVSRGQKIGTVGATSATSTLSPHLHYEQISGGSVVVSVVQGVTWSDFTDRNLTSTNGC